jgi:branched-chain amino acid transport system permease protein
MRLAAAFCLLRALAACGVDVEQQRVCERALPALHLDEPRIEITGAGEMAADAVRLDYRLGESPAEHWIVCQFAGSGFGSGRLELVDVTTDTTVRFSAVRLFLLKRFWLAQTGAALEAAERLGATGAAGRPGWPYLLQQLLNALVVGSFYSLLAVAFSLLYAVIGRINLAFGDFATLGAYGSVLGVALLGGSGLPAALALAPALALAVAVAGGHGWLAERLVLRPLAGRDSQAVLVATIGLAIALREYVRLAQGADGQWLQPVLNRPHLIADPPGFPVYVTTMQMLVVGLTLAAAVALWRFVRASRWGRAWRACSEDRTMAALAGVDVDRVVATSFVLAAACTALAGFLIAAYYGGIGPYMGLMLGFKALVAAIAGGLGSLPGALVGGFLVGALETFWSAYVDGTWRDVAVFGLLAALLALRPGGLGAAGDRRAAFFGPRAERRSG